MTAFEDSRPELHRRPTRRLKLASAFAVIVFAVAVSPTAALEPENTVVVVNADSWASTWVANEFIAARRIPSANVIYLSELPNFEQISVEAFRERILRPVLKTIADRGLAAQIDCVTYSADFPAAIDVSADIAGRRLPPVITPLAAINGLTFLHELVLAKDIRYLDLAANFYARRVISTALDTPWTEDEQRQYAESIQRWQAAGQQRRKALDELKKKKDVPEKKKDELQPAGETEINATFAAAVAESVTTLRALAVAHPRSADLLYNLACGLAVSDKADDALAALQQAVDAGWWNYGHAARDDDFRALRDRDEFKKLLARMKDAKFDVQPTTAFAADAGWLPNGERAPDKQGSRYLLSTVLAYTSGRGNSVREAVTGLRRSAAADGTRPPGTIYFLRNGDVRSTTREWAFDRAAEQLKQLGVATEVLPGVLPPQKADVAGAMLGIADFAWKSSGSTLLPGAICEHLTSFGGVLQEGAGQTPLTELIRHGAAGASGTVTEPYALQAKFPTPHLHVHYARGATLAEAFYQAVTGPYQLLIVGDPLCKPWAKRIDVTADGWPDGEPLAGRVTITPHASSPDGIAPASFDLFIDGRRTRSAKPGETLDWDTTKFSDGTHRIALVCYGADPVRSSGRLERSVVVRNGTAAFEVTALPMRTLPWTQRLELQANAPGATAIVLLHNHREVAQIAGPAGVASLDPRVLGAGPVRIDPVAKFPEDAREMHAPSLEFTIVPPAPLPPREPPAGANLVAGLKVTSDGKSTIIAGKTDGDWLASAGLKPDDRFTIEGWFHAPETDVYQFQYRGSVVIEALQVNDSKHNWPPSADWRFIPVPLAAGQHFLRIEARASDRAVLDLRFGNRGTSRIAGERFQHAP